MSNRDRVDFVPPHKGPTILPNSLLFSRLLRHAHQYPPRVAIRDANLGVEKTYSQLLTDVLSLRTAVEGLLSPALLRDLDAGVETYIGVLAPGGYEFAVAVLAVLALGATVVPMSAGTALPVEEASYFVEKSRQVALLASSGADALAKSLVQFVKVKKNDVLPSLTVSPHLQAAPLSPSSVCISSDRSMNDSEAGILIFTSGTTGPPKGAVMRRAQFNDAAMSVADHFELSHRDVILHSLPVHHATGIGLMFFPFLSAGSCIEFRSGSFDPQWTWERWCRGGLTFFSGVPTIYVRLWRYYERKLAKIPTDQRNAYVDGARQFRAMLCGTSALPSPVQKFWTNICGGKKILTRYGGTEFGGVFKVAMDSDDTPDGSVGEPIPGVDIKLSEEKEGEVLVKSPYMFSKYLFDEEATARAHDAHGYFKTGDIARKEGKHYFILGRASLDIIKSGGYKISALDIEREILSLHYIDEVMVVGVEDDEFGQRVAALISLREDQEKQKLTISDLRADLRHRLAGYKMPTLLRVVQGQLPKTSSGKVLKKVLGPRFFPRDWKAVQEVQAWSPKPRAKL